MCGIFSFISKKKLTNNNILMCRKATNLLKHRGPDGTGEWYDIKKGIYIGHQRLSIIDLSKKAKQPMKKHNLVLSYNGEIYNFNSLRNNLLKNNISFFSKSDSEVILSLWKKKGIRSLNILDGMFSFLIWDGTSTWIARDKFGEKPLYYSILNEGIYVSSELKPLIKILKIKKIKNSKIVNSFLTLGYVPSPYTTYENTYSLNSGSFLKISKGKIVKKKRYCNLEKDLKKIKKKSFEETFVDKFHEELIQSVKSRYFSDAEKCLFLSSGTDSSLIASIISKELRKKIQCITISSNYQFDESKNAKKIANFLSLPHFVENYYSNNKILVNDFINLYSQPNDNLTILFVKKMSKIAKKLKYKVGITGNGGDELTRGYLTQRFIYKYRYMYLIPEEIRKSLLYLLLPLKKINRKIDIYEKIFAIDDIFLYIALKNNPLINIYNKLPEFKEWCSDTFSNFKNHNLYEKSSFFDLINVMPNSRLNCFDLGSMSEGIELRSPFLNTKLFELYQSIKTDSILIKEPKYVLKEILKRYLPNELIFKYKKGFIYPFSDFIKNNNFSQNEIVLNRKIFKHKDKKSYSWQKLIIRKNILDKFFTNY
ncbi:MAG: asparagine synthase (glutamine-hydrolyzing) [Pelagibacteraceae bacterium]|nr:asparagine synthase (glutamine-hydrolyzing) [Pelagibacteraceae bacterium]